MTWHETDDVEQWLAACGDLLFPQPGRHSIALTQAENVRRGDGSTRFAYWHSGISGISGGDVTGCALWRAPFPVLVSAAPDEALRPLCDLWSFTQVSGETELAVQTAVLAARGRRVRLVRAERLFRLGTLVLPDVPGTARTATPDDRDTVLGWVRAFLDEAVLANEDPAAMVDERVGRGQFLLWEVDGRAVSLAGHQLPAFGGVRVGPVYTPPEERGRGYGGAVTAAVSAKAQSLGSEVVLYTDLTNPTSNALYPRLGYARVSDKAVLEITPE